MRATQLASCTLLLWVAGADKPDGTCGYQCSSDSDCAKCGSAGKCSCPDGADAKYPAISCSCVSQPSNAPTSPMDWASVAWPQTWTANVDAWCYGDFTNKTATAKGKFYYDATVGKTRGEWTPYINGKDATQVWIVDKEHSQYYVKSGPICIYFPITDPGVSTKPIVGIERADWMKHCHDMGMAKSLGREQVNVDGEDVWVDHTSCHLDYEDAKQQITFQNWHSIGLNSALKPSKVQAGMPVRVTGGNSAPNPTKGSPRLNSVWYTNFSTNAIDPKLFTKPAFFCIPVATEEVKAFFGHDVRPAHTFNPAFHRRAHYLTHAKATVKDLRRAKQPKPGRAFKGDTFTETMQKLNRALLGEKGLRTQKCDNFSLELLQEMQLELFNARTHELDTVYKKAGDTRGMAHATLEAMEGEQAKLKDLKSPSLLAKARDGACHEMVMWYVHHLSESAREEIKERLILPLLPEMQHETPAAASNTEDAHVHSRYDAQVSCAVCHVDPTSKEQSVVV